MEEQINDLQNRILELQVQFDEKLSIVDNLEIQVSELTNKINLVDTTQESNKTDTFALDRFREDLDKELPESAWEEYVQNLLVLTSTLYPIVLSGFSKTDILLSSVTEFGFPTSIRCVAAS